MTNDWEKTRSPGSRDIREPDQRGWEEFSTVNRWQYDKVVRSTHGVNCTGGCTWMVYVKNGLVDLGAAGAGLQRSRGGACRPYEPRGCQRGITFSWHLYSPTRVKYPYIRGSPAGSCGRRPRAEHDDPVAALESRWSRIRIPVAAGSRAPRQRAASAARIGATVLEIMAAANIPYDQDPRPGPHHRFLADSGNVDDQPCLWVADAATDGRSADLVLRLVLRPAASLAGNMGASRRMSTNRRDWFNAKLLGGGGVEPEHDADARTFTSPARARHNGSKMWVFSPDFSQVSKYADEWGGGQCRARWGMVDGPSITSS